jgi:polar amino acid transport system permease protein
MNYDWDFHLVLQNQGVLWQGFLGTLEIGVCSLFFGLIVGLVFAAMRMSRHRLLSVPATAAIEFLRMTPLLVQLFWVFFALPIILGISLSAFMAGLITLSIQSGAFYAEAFRGGIQSIHQSQWEGARAIGMRHWQLMHRIILPQAVRRMLPPLMERSFELLKGTTQLAAITYGDLLYNSLVLSSQLYRPVEILTCVAAFYLVLLTLLSLLIRFVEHRIEARQG